MKKSKLDINNVNVQCKNNNNEIRNSKFLNDEINILKFAKNNKNINYLLLIILKN